MSVIKCPKCNKKINGITSKCPFCKSAIDKKNVNYFLGKISVENNLIWIILACAFCFMILFFLQKSKNKTNVQIDPENVVRSQAKSTLHDYVKNIKGKNYVSSNITTLSEIDPSGFDDLEKSNADHFYNVSGDYRYEEPNIINGEFTVELKSSRYLCTCKYYDKDKNATCACDVYS